MNRSFSMLLIAIVLADSLRCGWLLWLWGVVVSIPFLLIGAIWFLLLECGSALSNLALYRIRIGGDPSEKKER